MPKKKKPLVNRKVIEGTIMEKSSRQESELRPWQDGYGFYGEGRILGYALFDEFEGRRVKITIVAVDEKPVGLTVTQEKLMRHRLYKYLVENSGTELKAKQMAEDLKLKPSYVANVLWQLKTDGLVVNTRKGYWKIVEV